MRFGLITNNVAEIKELVYPRSYPSIRGKTKKEKKELYWKAIHYCWPRQVGFAALVVVCLDDLTVLKDGLGIKLRGKKWEKIAKAQEIWGYLTPLELAAERYKDEENTNNITAK